VNGRGWLRRRSDRFNGGRRRWRRFVFEEKRRRGFPGESFAARARLLDGNRHRNRDYDLGGSRHSRKVDRGATSTFPVAARRLIDCRNGVWLRRRQSADLGRRFDWFGWRRLRSRLDRLHFRRGRFNDNYFFCWWGWRSNRALVTPLYRGRRDNGDDYFGGDGNRRKILGRAPFSASNLT
jgi:hypothetical protein